MSVSFDSRVAAMQCMNYLTLSVLYVYPSLPSFPHSPSFMFTLWSERQVRSCHPFKAERHKQVVAAADCIGGATTTLPAYTSRYPAVCDRKAFKAGPNFPSTSLN